MRDQFKRQAIPTQDLADADGMAGMPVIIKRRSMMFSDSFS